MLCNGYDEVLELSHGEIVELTDARGTTVRVTKGTVWLTQQDDTQDVVLRQGDVWTIERQGLTLLEAHGETLVCVVGERVAAVRSRTSTGLRLRDWVRSLWGVAGKDRIVPYY
jgi:DUF2917 family protein